VGALEAKPLEKLDDWQDFVADRYRPDRKQDEFRSYEKAPAGVREFYRLNHANQTLDFVRAKHAQYVEARRERASMWEILERLNNLVDDSDPDTDLPQIMHALQTAEHIREDGHPDWMQLVGLVHDSGKMLCFYGEPQWAVVGDTFPAGCAWSPAIVFHEFFAANPDRNRPELQDETGIYERGCGLANLQMSWGHDEYIYQVLKDSRLPAEGLVMLRFHSFYPWHREGAYQHFMNDEDRRMLPWSQLFSQYDLYSKSDKIPDVAEVKPYYQSLIDKYLPAQIDW
jgi:inositol oxygenase